MDEKIDKAIETAKGIVLVQTKTDDMQKAAQSVLNLKIAKSIYGGLTNPTEDMDEELTFVLSRVRSNLDANALVQATQAVLHLMHAKASGEAPSRIGGKKQGTGAS